ncbi:uncharacterized protein BJ212DRAFT_1295755 [Suillus subaureus]|uniref:Uncharacterized protein n=1 Tax=Suillus subaureus TaxID=48587 RepID=A0A9P7ELU9_9AGAM|nr:uncharacterized protein BJ212DRAFT_1295755 [Suillus subaureus]KAG1824630.1 hypothetical protein BJ212DRAFT_1295755 [Suillus subaureus]
MLIDIKATLLRQNEDARKIELTQLKELLDSKDFKMLKLQQDFVRKHHNVFKIPVAMLEDVELKAQLSKMVSDLLSSIHGNIKAKNRFAFLRHCLHIFLIRVDNYKTVPLKVLFSNSLIPSLHDDLRIKINEKLGIDMDAIECRIHGNVDQDLKPNTPTDSESFLDEDHLMQDTENTDNGSQQENEGENIRGEGAEDEDQGEGDLPVDEENSGSESKGRPAVYSLSKFWKFVDDSLNGIHKLARAWVSEQEGMGGSLTYEHAFHDILVEYFQLDLAEFPGRRTILKLLTTTSPQWQTTIQNQLLCNNMTAGALNIRSVISGQGVN